MEILAHPDVEQFAQLARPLLATDPVRHTVALTVLDSLCRSAEPAAVLLTVHEAGGVVGAALATSSRPVLVSAVPRRHAVAVEAAVAAIAPDLPGASGPTAEARAFAAARAARTGARVHVERRTRLFVLHRLVPPQAALGGARGATEDDVALLADWRRAFVEEDGRPWVDPLPPSALVARSLRLGSGEMIWEVDGVAVAQASARPVVAGMSRIGPVYTPPEHRRQGYGGAVTAAASQWALDAGAERVLLFTDLGNRTSNALYPRLGYRPVHDALDLVFRA